MNHEARRHRSRVVSTLTVALSAAGVGTSFDAAVADALPTYVHQIYPFSGGFGGDEGYDLNDAGRATGGAAVPTETGATETPALWEPDGGMLLDVHERSGRGYGLNAFNVVVGVTEAFETVGFICQNGVMSPLAPIGASEVEPNAISDTGVIVGLGRDDAFRPFAVRWTNGVPEALAVDPMLDVSVAFNINDAGLIVGVVGAPDTWFAGYRPVVWRDGDLEWLEPPVGGLDDARAVGLNDAGVVVGHYRPAGSSSDRACFWTFDETLESWVRTDIADDVPGAGSRALAINNAGVIVGMLNSDFTLTQSFVWSDGRGARIDDLIMTAAGVLSECTVQDINASGQILCFAHDLAGSTGRRAILLTPYSDDLCLADIDEDGLVGITDLVTLLAHWGDDGPGDINASGTVDLADLIALLADWGPC